MTPPSELSLRDSSTKSSLKVNANARELPKKAQAMQGPLKIENGLKMLNPRSVIIGRVIAILKADRVDSNAGLSELFSASFTNSL